MKGDFSRDTFDKNKHFSRVLMQQGRVQIDADWNEQTDILLHYLRTLAADLIGPFASPVGQDGKPTGFEIKKEGDTFTIGAGRYYVDGILCENATITDYNAQQDFPRPPVAFSQLGNYLVYLDVWERYISAVEDDYIREKALGGPDSAGRCKVVWQVKLHDISNIALEGDLGEVGPMNKAATLHTIHWQDTFLNDLQPKQRGCLRARVKPSEPGTDPCLIAPDSKFRGNENQLYRVEIHTGVQANNNAAPTFKWSRDNAMRVSTCELTGDVLTVDDPRGFEPGKWVELLNNEQEMRNEPGTLAKVIKVEAGQVYLNNAPSKPDLKDKHWPSKVRLWDHKTSSLDGAIAITESDTDWIDLEDGIQIQFQLPLTLEVHDEGQGDHQKPAKPMNRYRTGDYWLIPARVATGNIEWPVQEVSGKNDPLPQAPHGIHHHYAPLALFNAGQEPEDCRCAFKVSSDCGGQISHGADGMAAPANCSAQAKPGDVR